MKTKTIKDRSPSHASANASGDTHSIPSDGKNSNVLVKHQGLSKGESAHNAGPTPTEYGDRWEPLRSKLSIKEAQFLNTYTKTGDIAALNALVLGIIESRDKLREQRDELLVACRVLLDSVDWSEGNCKTTEMIGAVLSQSVIDIARAAIKKAQAQ